MTIPKPIVSVLRAVIIIALPLLLMTGYARLLMTPLYLNIEYTRIGFPDDRYGFTTEDRIRYGSMGLHYMISDEDISYLGDIRLEGSKCFPPQADECPAFNYSELKHMEDVQFVARGIFTVAGIVAIITLISAGILWRFVNIQALYLSLMQGSILTFGLIIAMILTAIIAWNAFFASFHALFFEDGTWQFYYSDTLIRLYPEQFWIDTALTIGVLVVFTTLGILIFSWQKLAAQPTKDAD